MEGRPEIVTKALVYLDQGWALAAGYIKAQDALRPATRELALKAAAIEIPFPHRVVEIKGGLK